MKKQNYLLIKKSYEGKISDLNCKKIDGFKFNPKNQVKYEGVMVNEMVIINPSFIENILKRKTKNKLELYLKFIINLIDDDSSTSSDDLREALNGLARYKTIVINKYQKYLDEKYMNILMKKIDLLEQELKSKILYYKEPIKEDKKTR